MWGRCCTYHPLNRDSMWQRKVGECGAGHSSPPPSINFQHTPPPPPPPSLCNYAMFICFCLVILLLSGPLSTASMDLRLKVLDRHIQMGGFASPRSSAWIETRTHYRLYSPLRSVADSTHLLLFFNESYFSLHQVDASFLPHPRHRSHPRPSSRPLPPLLPSPTSPYEDNTTISHSSPTITTNNKHP